MVVDKRCGEAEYHGWHEMEELGSEGRPENNSGGSGPAGEGRQHGTAQRAV